MGRKQVQSAETVWRDRLARYLKSDLRVAQFCERERVSQPSFYQWRNRLAADQPSSTKPRRARRSGSGPVAAAPRFVPVNVGESVFAEVEFPNGVRIRVPATNAEALRVAISTGNQLCREAC